MTLVLLQTHVLCHLGFRQAKAKAKVKVKGKTRAQTVTVKSRE